VNREYCYNLLNSPLGGTQWSFKGIILRIISNTKKLLPYLEYGGVFEYIKGIRSRRRDKGIAESFAPLKPPEEEV